MLLRPLFIILSLLLLLNCNTNTNLVKEEKNKENKKGEVKKQILGLIEKIEIPRIESKDKKVKVMIWGKMPSEYCKEKETIIEKTDTGYTIKIIFEESEEKKDLSFYKEVYIEIPKGGGYDIEVVGEKNSLIDIVYIDE
ncbi:MAG TPA: hypothetical protein PKW55_01625 [Spirochaetota bacterium]|nr:hypothetical protein [Spirochaetota bacterium]HOM38917.1 hypothetical protein [Spirochaetota bacterium]HPQ49104.1 hypothetical protein [Spirochaetota bacterium]